MSNDFLNEINKLKTNYYSKNPKNILFPSKQKMDCAQSITNVIDFDKLIQNTIYQVRDTNKIFIDYTVFKIYANPENYLLIIDSIFSVFDSVIHQYGSFEIHFNLNTFSVTACQRYKKIIELFIEKCIQKKSEYTKKVMKLYLYYTPTVFDNIALILQQWIHPEVRDKFVLYNKIESIERTQQLFLP